MPEAKITLPEGMTQEQFMKAFETFQTARIAAKERDKSVRAAIKDLIKAHPAEYDALVARKPAKG